VQSKWNCAWRSTGHGPFRFHGIRLAEKLFFAAAVFLREAVYNGWSLLKGRQAVCLTVVSGPLERQCRDPPFRTPSCCLPPFGRMLLVCLHFTRARSKGSSSRETCRNVFAQNREVIEITLGSPSHNSILYTMSVIESYLVSILISEFRRGPAPCRKNIFWNLPNKFAFVGMFASVRLALLLRLCVCYVPLGPQMRFQVRS
jgi:hypothetical protein